MATFRSGGAVSFSSARSVNFSDANLAGLGVRPRVSATSSGSSRMPIVAPGRNLVGQNPALASRVRLFLQPENLWSRLQLARVENPGRVLGYAGLAAMLLGISWEGAAGMFAGVLSAQDPGKLTIHFDVLATATDESLLIRALRHIEQALVGDSPDSERIEGARDSMLALMARPKQPIAVYREARIASENLRYALPEQASRRKIREFVDTLAGTGEIGARLSRVEVEAALLELFDDALAQPAELKIALSKLADFGPWDLKERETLGTQRIQVQFLTERLREFLSWDPPREKRLSSNGVALRQILGLTESEATILERDVEQIFRKPGFDLVCELLALRQDLDQLHKRLLVPQPSGLILKSIFSWVKERESPRDWLRAYLAFYPQIDYFRETIWDFLWDLQGQGVRLYAPFTQRVWSSDVEIPTAIRSFESGARPWEEQVAAFQAALKRLAEVPGEERQREVLSAVFPPRKHLSLESLAAALDRATTDCWRRHGAEIALEQKVRRLREEAADRRGYTLRDLYDVYREIADVQAFAQTRERAKVPCYEDLEGMLKIIRAYFFSNPDGKGTTHLDEREFEPLHFMRVNNENFYHKIGLVMTSLRAELSVAEKKSRENARDRSYAIQVQRLPSVIAALDGLLAILRVIRG